jgi:hypothetical protein
VRSEPPTPTVIGARHHLPKRSVRNIVSTMGSTAGAPSELPPSPPRVGGRSHAITRKTATPTTKPSAAGTDPFATAGSFHPHATSQMAAPHPPAKTQAAKKRWRHDSFEDMQ